MNAPGRLILSLTVALLVCSIAVAGGAAIGLDSGVGSIVLADENDGNETVRHANPDTYDEGGDSDRIAGWLSDRLSSQLAESSAAISEGEYERAREILGDEYREQLEQYVEVSGETDDGEESAFERAADQQETYADTLEQFNETQEEYERALEDGDDERTRELARELVSLAEELDNVSVQLTESYDAIGNETGEDFSDVQESITGTSQETNETTYQIREQTFVETALTVETENDSISFLHPLSATGELETADDSMPESITVEVREGTQRVDVDDDGRFEFVYHPTDLPLDADSITVSYVPEPNSSHLGSETTVNVSVEQDEPTITDLTATGEVAYNDTIAVGGTILVDGSSGPIESTDGIGVGDRNSTGETDTSGGNGGAQHVDGVPLEVTLDGERLGELMATNGTVEGEFDVPAAVSAGEVELRVALPFEDRALSGTAATQIVTVAETETAIEVDAELDEGTDEDGESERLVVEGALETAEGEALANQSVEIRIDGSTVTTAETHEDGTFAANASVPPGAGDSLEVEAVFDGRETSLAGTKTATTIELTTAGGWQSVLTWFVAGLGVTGLLVGAGVWYWYRRRARVGDEETDEHDERGDQERSTADDESRTPATPSPIAVAADLLSSGRPDDAVTAAYAGVRRTLAAQVEDAERLTHWEFYTQYRGAGRDALRDLTERYERAAFAPEGCSEGEASAVLERARELCGGEVDRRSQPSSDD